MDAAVATAARIAPRCQRVQMNRAGQVRIGGLGCQRRRLARRERQPALMCMKSDQAVVDSNSLPYCGIDGKTLTMGEKENLFLDALQAYYYGEGSIMSNEEFDNLKEDLIWGGSSVVVLSPLEQRFLEAVRSFNENKPVLTDEEYDALKAELKKQNSPVAMSGPRCSLRSRKVVSDLSVDYFRLTLLNIPGAVIALAGLFLVDDLVGFEITEAIELPEPAGGLILWLVIIPLLYLASSSVTQALLQSPMILKGTCPNCGAENVAYFGRILNIAGAADKTCTKPCVECKSPLEFSQDTRILTLVDTK